MLNARAGFGVAAVSCVIAIVVLSWLPKDMEVRTGLAGQLEHVVAYLGTGALACFARGGARTGRLAIAFVLLAAILEVGQLWIPGRNAQLIDFVSSSAGALAGLFVATCVLRVRGVERR